MKTLLGAVLILTALFIHFYLPSFKSPPTPIQAENLSNISRQTTLQPIKTQSRFKEELVEKSETIQRQIIYKDDSEKEAGEDTVLEEGEDGTKTTITKITYYKPDISNTSGWEEYSREIIGTEFKEPQNKIISRGTKIVWRTLNTPDGQIKYWKKIRVYATHYDSRCLGCSDWTAIGLKAGYGVIAVDPKVIKLRSQIYIPEYGMAVAGDTGGAIKGNIIDLGFDDAKTAGWKAKFTDIYILN